jgi:putative hemolysin
MDPEAVLLLELAGALVVLMVITVYAVIENTLSRMTRVDIKLLLDRIKGRREDRVLAQLAKGKFRVLIPLQHFLHFLQVLLALLIYSILDQLLVPLRLPLTLLAMLVLVLLLHQWIPWAMAGAEPERTFVRLIRFLRPVYYLFSVLGFPVIRLAARRHEALQETEDGDDEISDEEVQAFLDVGEEEGIFEQAESRIIQQVVEFGDTIVREIMVPRTDMVAISHTATLEELKQLMVQSSHSRIPVYQERIDAIVGVVYVRHLLARYSPDAGTEPITEIIRPATYVPETKRVSELLREMQEQGEHLTIVVDEYGGVAGLVTLEDLLEEIVGEIRDEDQLEEISIRDEGDAWIIDGDAELSDIDQAVGVDLWEEGYNTIAGLIIKHLGRLPQVDEILTLNGVQIQVLDVDERKIHRVRVRRLHEDPL